MAYKIASRALNVFQVNIFLYLDAVHIPKSGQNPSHFILNAIPRSLLRLG
jgi:tRNA 2-thiouridine synthesizing protein D